MPSRVSPAGVWRHAYAMSPSPRSKVGSCAARHADDFETAIWSTLRGLGDRDTTCAIVGGIVSLSAPPETVPDVWRASREALAFQPTRPNRALRVGEPVDKPPLRAQ